MAGKAQAVILCAALLGSSVASAKAEMTVATVSFGGSTNWQTWVAQDRGFFQRQGLTVRLSTTKGSVKEAQDLLAGKYQIMSSAFDNIVADIEGQGEKNMPGAANMVAFMGVHSGLETLISRPQIAKAADLKGKTVAVDARKAGYALVLYRLLEEKGLTLDTDYRAVAFGGTSLRLHGLEADKAQAALVSPPLDMEMAKKGYHILGKSSDLGPYQGSVYVALKSWADAHQPEMNAYIRGIVAATDYIFANKQGAIAVLKQHMQKLSDARAEALYAEMTGPEGLDPKAKINMQGVANVLKLREEFGEPHKKLDPPSRYIDEIYYRRATAAN